MSSRKSASSRKKILFFAFVVLVCAVTVGVCFLREESSETEKMLAAQVDGNKAQKCRAEQQRFEAEFNARHEAKREKIESEDIDIFEKAVAAYEEFLKYSGMDARSNARLDKMRRKLHSLRADKIRERTLALEEQAEKLASAKKYAAAEKLFRQAADLEREIETKYSLAEKRKSARTAELQTRMRAMQAIPMTANAEALEKSGNAALEKQDWAAAKRDLSKALNLRNRLWRDFRGVSATDSQSIARLNRLVATADSAEYYEKTEALKKSAAEAEAREDWDAARAARKEALAVQSELSEKFPRSRFADSTRIAECEIAYANAGARPDFATLLALRRMIDDAVRSRATERVPFLARRAAVLMSNMKEKFPQNTLVSEKLRGEIAYFNVKGGDIPQIQKALFSALLPIPGVPAKTRMLRTEVSQALYTFVMGENPSADISDPLAPVESVSVEDAEAFCARLSLLLGGNVRLPTLAEFRAAAGTFDEEADESRAWTLDNADMRIHRCGTKSANAAGFRDLYGNVAEWLADAESNGAAILAGGDCQTPAQDLVKSPFRKAPRREKSRLRGFRIVAEFPEILPAAGTAQSF